ncbi:MAG: nitroreductase family protein [Clostridia bacterium]|nr:nitroreductase family protein [Clostridia bacterium]
MNEQLERWYLFASQRCSIRKYRSSPISADIEELETFARSISAGGVRIVISKNRDVFSPIFLAFGKITGTSAYAAFIAKRDTPRWKIGYVGEMFILECCARGFGTCWLGASYKKESVATDLKLNEDEYIACITPVGVSDERYIGRPRKGLDALTGLKPEELRELPEWQKLALECARNAPSAVNGQPWRFNVSEAGLSIIQTSRNYGYGELDCGIAMLHMELGAAHGGVYGDWRVAGERVRADFQPAI